MAVWFAIRPGQAAAAMIIVLMEAGPALAQADAIGRARRIDGGAARYVAFTKSTFPKGLRLDWA